MARTDARAEARERALYLAYEAETKGLDAGAILDAQVIAPDALTEELVRGVSAQCAELDQRIALRSEGWTLERMPIIDLLVMRIAVYELLQRPDVPTAVILDQAVGLAKRFSTEASGRFVNGVLSAVARDLGRLDC